MATAFYLQKLREDFSKRQRTNPAYSLRAYSRDLGIHPSTLSQVLRGIRPLPFKHSRSITDRLRLGGKDRTLFSDSVGRKHIALDQIRVGEDDRRFILDETYFQIIAEWEHFAVLALFDCADFKPNSDEVRERLGLSRMRTEVVLANLLRYGLLLREKDGTLVQKHAEVRTTEDVASSALRASHQETLDLGKTKLESVPIELRDFSSMTVAIDPEKLPEFKAILREFRRKVAELAKTGHPSAVYQLGQQFYPISQSPGKTLPSSKDSK
jgi:uncharacterized protein (TIGR02147 family)